MCEYNTQLYQLEQLETILKLHWFHYSGSVSIRKRSPILRCFAYCFLKMESKPVKRVQGNDFTRIKKCCLKFDALKGPGLSVYQILGSISFPGYFCMWSSFLSVNFKWRGWSKDFLGLEIFNSGIFLGTKIWQVFF